ncbi:MULTISPECIES: DUF5709 domain-containing protein [unclassified Streptomyces]|uniref:DUF5709 domain-containing protein n=1 Tax=Streptomyces sp. NPDC005955 TaxID=3364738 RepID=UPI0036A1FC10
MDRDNARGDDVYQPDGSEVQDDEGLLDAADTLVADGVDDPLDRGYSPPDRPRAVDREDLTFADQLRGETLDERLAEELPDVREPEGDGIGDTVDTDGEPRDGEVGAARAGRLVAPDEGAHENTVGDLVAQDVGIDGAAASAEEAAVHLVEPEDERAARDGW